MTLSIITFSLHVWGAFRSLAYLTAKTNGLNHLTAKIPKAAGLTKVNVDDVPTFGVLTLQPLTVVMPATDLLWPSLSSDKNFFDHALVNGQLKGIAAGSIETSMQVWFQLH